MASFNKTIIMGNLVADPESRVTPGGMAICKFTLAVNRVFTTKDGEKREEVSYVDVDAFGRSAETIARYLNKGSPLLVEGRLKQERWETPQGEKRSKLIVVCEAFRFVGGKGGTDEPVARGDASGKRGGDGGASPSRGGAAPPDDVDEDVPF